MSAPTVTLLRPEAESRMAALPSMASPSQAAARVTACQIFQSDGVNVRLAPDCTETLGSPAARAAVIITLAAGWEESFTRKDAVPPSGTRAHWALGTMPTAPRVAKMPWLLL